MDKRKGTASACVKGSAVASANGEALPAEAWKKYIAASYIPYFPKMNLQERLVLFVKVVVLAPIALATTVGVIAVGKGETLWNHIAEFGHKPNRDKQSESLVQKALNIAAVPPFTPAVTIGAATGFSLFDD